MSEKENDFEGKYRAAMENTLSGQAGITYEFKNYCSRAKS